MVAVGLGDVDVREVLSGVLDVTLSVLAHDGFFVSAGYVVPFDAIAVEVVEHGQAGLFFASFLAFSVIGLTVINRTGVINDPLVQTTVQPVAITIFT